jgi:hypothetical protein
VEALDTVVTYQTICDPPMTSSTLPVRLPVITVIYTWHALLYCNLDQFDFSPRSGLHEISAFHRAEYEGGGLLDVALCSLAEV